MKSSAIMEVVTDQAEQELLTRNDLSLIGAVPVSLTAQVGTVTMSVEQLFGLKSGDIVTMNELLDAPMTLLLNGRAIARGELLAVDDNFGVRILELL